jgi:hypothetical protein
MHLMSQAPRNGGHPKKRRTTLTLPADSLTLAERLAQARQVNLSTVVSEALSEGLRLQIAQERSEEVLKAYKKAFSGFSHEEILLLDGVILEPVADQ